MRVRKSFCDMCLPQSGWRRAYLASALWQDTGPGDGEAKHLSAQLFHGRNVLFVAVVKVACHVTCVASMGPPWSMGKGVPDTRAPAILVNSALNL